jgi:predicted HAD superfamily Cof-like phosphohydrolase
MTNEQRSVQTFHEVGGQVVGDYAAPGLALGAPGYDDAHQDMIAGLATVAGTLHAISKTLAGSGWGTPSLRARLMVEELGEVVDAMVKGDVVELADGLADLQYVLLGTAVSAGIDLGPVFDEVCKKNLEKFPTCPDCAGRGRLTSPLARGPISLDRKSLPESTCRTCQGHGRLVIRDAGGKVQKPKGWTPPDIAAVLAKQRAAHGGFDVPPLTEDVTP